MKKIALGLLTLCFSVQARSAEPIVKTGSLWLDQPYKVEVTYLPSLQEAKLTSVGTYYQPCEQDCNYLRPAECWTNLNFEFGTVQIRILLGDHELANETSKVTGRSSITRTPLDYNVCEQNLPVKGTYSVYPLKFEKQVVFTSNKKTFKLDFESSNSSTAVNIAENEIQFPINVNLTNLGGWGSMDNQSLRIMSTLHTEEEWAKIREEEKNQPYVDPSDKD